MISSTTAALLLALTSAVLPVAELPEQGEPLGEVAYVDDLAEAGMTNGELPPEALMAVNEHCLVEIQAAESWLLLMEHAERDGIELVARWCYRSIAAQQRTYDRNCPLQPAAGPESTTSKQRRKRKSGSAETEPSVTAEAAMVRVCRVPTARPGNSNHGWGRAVDLTVDGKLLTCGSESFEWLVENAPTYGWVHPAWAACGADKEEAWHWEWAGTAEVPAPAPKFDQTPL